MFAGERSRQNNETSHHTRCLSMLSTLCIIHKSTVVFSYSVITSFIMAHISQQLYSLQNHRGIIGNNDTLLFSVIQWDWELGAT